MRRVDDRVMRLRIRLLNRAFMRAPIRTREQLLEWWHRRYFDPRSFIGLRAAALKRKRLAGARPERPKPVFHGR